MSQVARIKRISFRGAPAYLGEDHGNPLYSGNPEKVANWLCDGFRTRFNQLRSNRCKYVYENGEQLFIEDGNPLLTPIGGIVVDVTHKQAREAFPHLAGIPTYVLESTLKIESTEWFSAIKRRKTSGGKLPSFRSRKRGDRRFSCWFNGGRNAVFHRTGKRSGMVIIRGQNPVRARRKGRWELRFHIVVSQPIREYTSVQVDLAKKQVTFVSPPKTVDRSNAAGTVGIDRGVTRTAALSDGTFFDIPETPELDKRIAAQQRRMAKSRVVAERQDRDFRNSNRYKELRSSTADLQRKRAAVKNNAIHVFTKHVAQSFEHIVLEALKTQNMSRKAKGKGASRKRGLNRGIQNARWTTMLNQLRYKAGIAVVDDVEVPYVHIVDPRYTSQRCSQCGHIEKDNRESQAVFLCKACGHADNADTNASENIKAKFVEGWTIPPQSKGKTASISVGTAPALKRKPPALLSS